EGAVAVVAVQGIAAELIGEINVIETVAIKISNGQAAAVVIQVALEPFPLLSRKEHHLEGDARPNSVFVKAVLVWSIGPLGPLPVVLDQDNSQSEGKQDHHDPGQGGKLYKGSLGHERSSSSNPVTTLLRTRSIGTGLSLSAFARAALLGLFFPLGQAVVAIWGQMVPVLFS